MIPQTSYEDSPKYPLYVCYIVRCFTFYHLDEATIREWLKDHPRIDNNDCVVHRFGRKERVQTTVENTVLAGHSGLRLFEDGDKDYRQPDDDPYDYEASLVSLLDEVWSRPLITADTEKYGGNLNVLSIHLRSVRNLLTHPWKHFGQDANEFVF